MRVSHKSRISGCRPVRLVIHQLRAGSTASSIVMFVTVETVPSRVDCAFPSSAVTHFRNAHHGVTAYLGPGPRKPVVHVLRVDLNLDVLDNHRHVECQNERKDAP